METKIQICQEGSATKIRHGDGGPQNIKINVGTGSPKMWAWGLKIKIRGEVRQKNIYGRGTADKMKVWKGGLAKFSIPSPPQDLKCMEQSL